MTKGASSIITRWAQQSCEEFSTPGMLGYGACLTLVAPLTVIYWMTDMPLMAMLAPGEPAVCWPFFSACEQWRSQVLLQVALVVMLAGGVVGAVAFWNRQLTMGLSMLVAVTLIRNGVVLLDYRLAANQHYMANWVTGVYLLSLSKHRSLVTLLCLFYFAAGLLKLTPEWLNGDALYGRRPFNMPSWLVPAACHYVLILETIVVWGVFSRRRIIFWFALSQILIFHIGSFWVVGFFYPVLMFLLLAILPLWRWSQSRVSLWPSAGRLSSLVLVISFIGLQAIPRVLSTDPAVTGEGRMFALNMFDAPLQCVTTATYPDGGQTRQLGLSFVQMRLHCDPIVAIAAGKSLCQEAGRGWERVFTLNLKTKRPEDIDFRTVVHLESFCANQPNYKLLKHNEWISSR